jgi:single-strand DNA-binding protein
MADFNRVFLIGRLTQDPEMRYTGSGVAVTDLRLATGRRYTTTDGDPREETLYIDCTVWKRQAENCCQFLKKGSAVHVEGYLKQESWEDRNTGEKRSKIKVEATGVQFLDSRRSGPGGEGTHDAGNYEEAPTRRSGPAEGSGDFRPSNGPGPRSSFSGGGGAPAPSAPPRRPAAPAPPVRDEDPDDIPF